jgi:arsenate reductase (glutaredoxin)
MIQFYCYSRCSTCKKAKQFLMDHQVSFEEKDIKNHDLTPQVVKDLHVKSKLPLKRLFNTSGNVYKELNLKEKLNEMDDAEAYELLASNGMLIKRPILISDSYVFFGFKEKDYEVLTNATRY